MATKSTRRIYASIKRGNVIMNVEQRLSIRIANLELEKAYLEQSMDQLATENEELKQKLAKYEPVDESKEQSE